MLLRYTVRKLTYYSAKSEDPFTIPCTYAAYYPHNAQNVQIVSTWQHSVSVLCLIALQVFLCFDV